MKHLVTKSIAFWSKMASTDDPEYSSDWDEMMGEVNSNGLGVGPASGHGISDGGAEGILSSVVSIPHHVTIRNCVAEYLGGSGIGGSQCDYVTFENCTAINNCWWGMYGNSGLGFIELVDTDDNTEEFKIVICNCVSAGNRHFIPWKAGTVRLSDGNGIIMDTCDEHAYNYQGKTLIANNLVYENGGSGIHAFRTSNVYVVNNTIFNNNATVELTWGELFANDARNMHMYNNIVYSRNEVPENPNADADKNGYNLFYNYKDNSVIGNANGNILGVNPMFTDVVPVVHMPEGFDTATDYDESWYKTKTAAADTTPNTWTQAANAIAAGWYPGAVYDVKTYGYDFTLSDDSPAWGAASNEWQAIAGGASYVNVIGIFSEVGAGTGVASEGQTEVPSYTDVAQSTWYYEAVNYVAAKGLMTGTDGKFFPNGSATIGQLTNALYSLDRSHDGYANAIDWAIDNNVIASANGNDSLLKIAREDAAVILYRYATYKGYDGVAVGELSRFYDGNNVSSSAVEAMTWAVGNGLINGIGESELAPRGEVTRAQLATILQRFCENVA